MLERFMDKVCPEPNSGCWLWTGNIAGGGYAYIGVKSENGKLVNKRDHRAMYACVEGDIPQTLVLDHLCRVRSCVNPDHLEPVTRAENVRRGTGPGMARDRKNSKNHCKNGHPLSGDNVRTNSRGVRMCITCYRAAWARHREKKGKAPIKTHCARGHPFSGDNLIVTKRQRRCRTCVNLAKARSYQKRKSRKAQ